ncbi:MAG TPA: hypothetical protein VMT28_17095 [Terriglobales bacterium]|jgi:hypothetical protein|nr:hypothetical protein [Terriglobales bacterium]
MNRRFRSLALLTALLLACTFLAGVSFAQNTSVAKPRFAVLPPHSLYTVQTPTANLSQWNGAYTHKGQKFPFTMVGPDPRTNNSTTTIPVFIIPVIMVYGASNGNMTFDPTQSSNFGSMSASQVLTSSPLFASAVDFVQGGVDLGQTQYIDAYQRGNFWKVVKPNSNYHVVLGTPTILPTQSITVSASQGSVITNPFLPGHKVGTMDIFAFDAKLQGFLSQFPQITPDTFPIFINYDVYLTEGGCCIGGYHSANGNQPAGQTYAYTSLVDQGSGVFSQDTAAASHEIGEWMDDPFVDNRVPCTDNSIMENGDPLVLDDHAFPVGGFTYHLQDLVFIDYFGASRNIPVNRWADFQNDQHSPCPGLP